MSDEGIQLRDVISRRLQGGAPQKSSISEVRQKMSDINVVQDTILSARQLAGADGLNQQLAEERAKLTEAAQERELLKDRLTATQIESIKDTMNMKLDQMRENAGAGDRKGVLDTLKEFNEASELLGMKGAAGSGIEQIRSALDLVHELTPQQRPLADQIREMLEAGELIKSAAGGNVAAPAASNEIEGARLQLEMLKMNQTFSLQIEEMKLGAAQKQREWELRMLEFQDARTSRTDEIQAKIQAERERTGILANGIELLGGAIAKATQEFGRNGGGNPPPSSSYRQTAVAAATGAAVGAAAGHIASRPRSRPGRVSSQPPQASPSGRVLQADEGEEGAVNCPECEAELFLAADAAGISCPNCGASHPVQRLERGHSLE